MKRVLISLALLLVCGVGMVSDHTKDRQFTYDQLQVDRQRFCALQTLELLQRQWSTGVENQASLDAQTSQLHQSMQPGERSVDAALVFVSPSMPPDGLKQYVKDTAELNIPVITRGIVNGDVRATASAIADLVGESNVGGMQIDLITSRKYDITAVSILIIACDNRGNTVDRLQGDLTLHQALKRVAEVGGCADMVRNLLREEMQ